LKITGGGGKFPQDAHEKHRVEGVREELRGRRCSDNRGERVKEFGIVQGLMGGRL